MDVDPGMTKGVRGDIHDIKAPVESAFVQPPHSQAQVNAYDDDGDNDRSPRGPGEMEEGHDEADDEVHQLGRGGSMTGHHHYAALVQQGKL